MPPRSADATGRGHVPGTVGWYVGLRHFARLYPVPVALLALWFTRQATILAWATTDVLIVNFGKWAPCFRATSPATCIDRKKLHDPAPQALAFLINDVWIVLLWLVLLVGVIQFCIPAHRANYARFARHPLVLGWLMVIVLRMVLGVPFVMWAAGARSAAQTDITALWIAVWLLVLVRNALLARRMSI